MQTPLIKKTAPISGINVTPIIDVALVLVIILLITAPVMTISDLEVDLPGAHSRGVEAESCLHLTLAESGEISVERERVAAADLGEFLTRRLQAVDSGERMVVVRADRSVPHDRVQALLSTARQAGAQRLAVATTLAKRETRWLR